MKKKVTKFIQHLSHDIDPFDEKGIEIIEEYLDDTMPKIGYIVMYFNGLEKHLDSILCENFTTRSDITGLIVINKLTYSSKVDLFKRFCDELHNTCFESEIEGYEKLIQILKEVGQLRNLVVHADWENTDIEGYTYVNMKISKNGINQEYTQFSEGSLEKIIIQIFKAQSELHKYWEKRNEKLYS